VWICRRDARIRRPLDELAMVTASGLPAVVPDVQLLYKAKHHLDKDERDFHAALRRLSPAQRAWLREALEIAHPGDPWLARLAASDAPDP